MLQLPSPTHPVLACVVAIEAALDEADRVDPSYMRTTDKRDAMLAIGRQQARLEALRLRLLAGADDVAELDASRDAGRWLAHQLRRSPGRGRRDQALATALDRRYPHVATELGAGRLQREQVEAIVSSLDDLPSDLDPEVLALAEKHLAAEGEHFAPRELRELGRRILQTVAPDIADEHERRRLDEADQRAAATTKLVMRPRGDGMTDVHARISDAGASRLLHHLHAFTNPQQPDNQQDPTAPDDRRTHAQRLGHAFVRLIESLDPSRLPVLAGDATTIVVTVDFETLKTGVGAATLSDDTAVSAEQARRLACTAEWLPAVMGGASQVLDLGRLRRLFSGHLRRAMVARDKHCRAVGCDHPASWCEAHHKVPWSQGGQTNLADGVLLCPFHHDRAHDTRYDVTYHPDGDVSFHRRV